MIKKNKIQLYFWPLLLLALITFLVFFRLDRADMTGDDALFSFRAVGMVDFMYSQRQTTPWQWFNPLPWWATLSFHDSPPLAFIFSHLSFEALGPTLLAARLPAALSGILTAIVLYLLAQRWWGRRGGIWALVFVAVSPMFVWLHQFAYYEPIVMPFLALTLYAYDRAKSDPKWYALTGLAFGLAALSKYTAYFLVPALILHLWLYRRADWKKAPLWRGLVIAFVCITPVLLYNLMMYQARGHMDVQLAGLLGQSNYDWPILQVTVSFNALYNAWTIIRHTVDLQSMPYAVAGILAVLYSGWRWSRSKRQDLALLLLSTLFWFIFMLLTKQDYRFIATGYIFTALALAYVAQKVSQTKLSWLRWSHYVLVIGICLTSLYYSYVTNHALQASGQPGWHYSAARREAYGYEQMTRQIEDVFRDTIPPVLLLDNYYESFDPVMARKRIFDPQTIDFSLPEAEPIVIFDQNVYWFAEIWHLKRIYFYDRHLVMSTRDAVSLLDLDPTLMETLFAGRPFIYYKLTPTGLLDRADYRTDIDQRIEKLLVANGISEIFYTSLGQPGVEVYRGNFPTPTDSN